MRAFANRRRESLKGVGRADNYDPVYMENKRGSGDTKGSEELGSLSTFWSHALVKRPENQMTGALPSLHNRPVIKEKAADRTVCRALGSA